MADRPHIEIALLEEQLWRDGRAVPVKGKVFDLLRVFLANPNRLLTKDEILEAVWPKTHVSDVSVKQAVKELRAVLRDDPAKPRYIETLRRRGYRYLGGLRVRDSPETLRPDRFTSFHARPAIAVLPFENLSDDPQQDYFSDGISEDIITLLSAWRLCPVIARSSSFAFKGRSCDIRQVAADLSARYVIEGSVRKQGETLRVTAELAEGSSGHSLWAGRYDGALEKIFEIQDDMTRQIVAAVEPCIEAAERAKAKERRAPNLDAWDCYLCARDLMHRITPAATQEARSLFERAIELDPAYADAYAGLSRTYWREVLFERAEDRDACLERALSLAQKAVALDGESSLAHDALGAAYIWLNQHELSIAETKLAVALNPSNIQAVLALGNRLDIVGQSAEGMPYLQKTLQLHPRDPYSHIYFAQLARAYINRRDYEKALDCLHESIRRKPDYPHTYHVLAICYGHLGRYERARQAAERCDALHPGFMKKRAQWNIYVDPAANAHLAEGLRRAGIASH